MSFTYKTWFICILKLKVIYLLTNAYFHRLYKFLYMHSQSIFSNWIIVGVLLHYNMRVAQMKVILSIIIYLRLKRQNTVYAAIEVFECDEGRRYRRNVVVVCEQAWKNVTGALCIMDASKHSQRHLNHVTETENNNKESSTWHAVRTCYYSAW